MEGFAFAIEISSCFNFTIWNTCNTVASGLLSNLFFWVTIVLKCRACASVQEKIYSDDMLHVALSGGDCSFWSSVPVFILAHIINALESLVNTFKCSPFLQVKLVKSSYNLVHGIFTVTYCRLQ